jgi:hypothetical protein
VDNVQPCLDCIVAAAAATASVAVVVVAAVELNDWRILVDQLDMETSEAK